MTIDYNRTNTLKNKLVNTLTKGLNSFTSEYEQEVSILHLSTEFSATNKSLFKITARMTQLFISVCSKAAHSGA